MTTGTAIPENINASQKSNPKILKNAKSIKIVQKFDPQKQSWPQQHQKTLRKKTKRGHPKYNNPSRI